MLTQACAPDTRSGSDASAGLIGAIAAGALTADELVARYCGLLYERHGTYVEVAKITGLDRRTVRKHVTAGQKQEP